MLKPCKFSRIGGSASSSVKDHISGLPDDILCYIISELPLRQAVQTSILSTRWRNLCRLLPILKFDLANLFENSDNFSDELSCYNTDHKDQFEAAVSQFLKSCQVFSRILSFKLSFCLGSDSSDNVDRWVSFAIAKGAKNISLKLDCDKRCFNKGCCPFSNKLLETGAYTNLKHLHLAACSLGSNFSSQFGCLETLSLDNVRFGLCDTQILFSSMVSLKVLKLKECSRLPAELSLCSLRQLKVFSLVYCNGVKKIDLCLVNLISYECISFLNQIITSNIAGASKLSSYVDVLKARGLADFFSSSSLHKRLRRLNLLSSSQWATISLPRKLTTFQGVKLLRLCFLKRAKFHFSKMISILRAFPCLRNLHLSMYCPGDFEEGGLEPVDFAFKHLENVYIKGFYTQNQVEFAIYLLRHAPVLKQLSIQREVIYHFGNCSNICTDQSWRIRKGERVCKARQLWKEEERQNICKRLQEFAKDAMVIVQ